MLVLHLKLLELLLLQLLVVVVQLLLLQLLGRVDDALAGQVGHGGDLGVGVQAASVVLARPHPHLTPRYAQAESVLLAAVIVHLDP
jgi:hypothetical protein